MSALTFPIESGNWEGDLIIGQDGASVHDPGWAHPPATSASPPAWRCSHSPHSPWERNLTKTPTGSSADTCPRNPHHQPPTTSTPSPTGQATVTTLGYRTGKHSTSSLLPLTPPCIIFRPCSKLYFGIARTDVGPVQIASCDHGSATRRFVSARLASVMIQAPRSSRFLLRMGADGMNLAMDGPAVALDSEGAFFRPG